MTIDDLIDATDNEQHYRTSRVQEAQGWLPIESAPRNDIIILANVTPTAIWWAKAAAWNGIGWYETGTGKGLNPTHWMPLPKPPTEARQDDVVLREKYKNLVKFYDDHVGTPCEQIRHQEEIAKLQAALKQAREALKFYANPGDYKAPYTGGMGKLYFDCGTVATEALSAIDAVMGNSMAGDGAPLSGSLPDNPATNNQSDDCRKAFESLNPYLDYTGEKEPWSNKTIWRYKHSHIQSSWEGYLAGRDHRDAELVGLLEKERSSYQRLENHGLDRAIELILNGYTKENEND